jgi:hypothetical protein
MLRVQFGAHVQKYPRFLEITLLIEARALVLYEAYFDETGDDGGFPIMAVGGYVIEEWAARKLEVRWQGILNEYALPYFHMVDCAHGTGVFAKISKPDRVKLQTRLMNLMVAYVDVGVVCAAPLKRFSGAPELGVPYEFCVDQCIFSINAILNARHQDRKWSLDCYYEQGHKYSSLALQRFEQNRSNFPNVKSLTVVKKDYSGLVQAADVLVWQFAKFTKDAATSDRQIRKDFLSLLRSPCFFPHIYPHKDRHFSMWYWSSNSIQHPDARTQASDIYNEGLSNWDLMQKHAHVFEDSTGHG